MKTLRCLVPFYLLTVLWLVLPLTVRAQLSFTTNNGTIAITGYMGTEPTLNIPSTINGLPVASIADGAFVNQHLSSVILPDTMLNIGSDGFNACTSLTNITFGANLKTIGEFAFGGCTNLGEVALPESLASIGN